MNKQNQSGSVHIVLISILVVVILGGIGFLFWNNFMQPKSEDKSVAKAESSQKASPSASPSPSVAAKPETLELSAWGVQFTVPDELKKAGVEVATETTYYSVSTSQQRAFGQLTDENVSRLCDAGSMVAVLRSDMQPSGTEMQFNTKPLNGYYYYGSIPSAGGCNGPDTKAIVQALKSLELKK